MRRRHGTTWVPRYSRDQLLAVLLRIANTDMSGGRYEAVAGSYREMVELD